MASSVALWSWIQVTTVLTCKDWVFVAGSGMLSISISLNALSTHSICTAGFVAIAAVIGFGLGSIQTLGQVTWMAWGGVSCIVTSCEWQP